MTDASDEEKHAAAARHPDKGAVRDDRGHDDAYHRNHHHKPHPLDDVEAGHVAGSTSSTHSAGHSSDDDDDDDDGHTSSGDEVSRISTTVSMGPDNVIVQTVSSNVEIPDEFYDRLSNRRKIVIVSLLSFCSFLAPISSTAVLAAIPEVAAAFNSTGSIVDLTNALYMLFMGISPIFWGPISEVYGRRVVSSFCRMFPSLI